MLLSLTQGLDQGDGDDDVHDANDGHDGHDAHDDDADQHHGSDHAKDLQCCCL